MGASVTIVDNAPHDFAGGTRRASPERAVREILDLRAKGDVEAILEVLAGEELLLPARAVFRCERKRRSASMEPDNLAISLAVAEREQI